MVDLPSFQRVFDQIGAALIVIDVGDDGKLRYALFNAPALAFFGLPAEQYVGKSIEPYLGQDRDRRQRREKTIAAYQRCVDSKSAVEFEVEHVTPDGDLRWGRHTIAPVFDEGDHVSHLIVTSIDVTELVHAQRQLEDALTQSLSGFVSICAHCKNIKSDEKWVPIDTYAAEKMNYHGFSHGLCPTCINLFDD